jgi:hypothetical protein
MFGISPGEQAYLLQAALISIVLTQGLTLVWLRRQYTLRGICKRLRCHL